MLLTTGMCNVASSTLGLYVAFLKGVFPLIAGHLLSASVLSIPAGVVMAKDVCARDTTARDAGRCPSR